MFIGCWRSLTLFKDDEAMRHVISLPLKRCNYSHTILSELRRSELIVRQWCDSWRWGTGSRFAAVFAESLLISSLWDFEHRTDHRKRMRCWEQDISTVWSKTRAKLADELSLIPRLGNCFFRDPVSETVSANLMVTGIFRITDTYECSLLSMSDLWAVRDH